MRSLATARAALLTLLVLAAAPCSAEPGDRPPARLEYYGELGCSHCDTFMDKELPAAEEASGVKAELDAYDILSDAGYARCEARLAELGYAFRVFPVLIVGTSAYQGNAAIEANLLPELRSYAESGAFRPSFDDGTAYAAGRGAPAWTVPAILVSGLIDGVNPCAFTTLLFFMSYLSLRSRTRRRAAAAGLAFAAGVFIAYFGIGYGVFNAFRLGGRLQGFRLALKLAVSVLTAAFCVATLRDIAALRMDRAAPQAMRLPDRFRSSINARIRAGTGGRALILGAFVAGVVVSVLELACTGQVYFPAISTMVQAGGSDSGLLYLSLYNLAFVLPLLAVLVLSLLGLRQEALRAFFARHLVASKAAQAALFAGLSIALWIT
ncbi:MAG TPA: cytochrome c biogenesis protein CcdA [Spirochaetia bacterium]|nr:cytochrome c biogenesis protein CcdA [Spirochaetia bacterium]